jgi:outer membrane protein, heavy metal efflux system
MRSRFYRLGGAVSLATTVCSIAGPSDGRAQPAALDERQYVEEVLRAGLEARVADAEAEVGRAEGAGAGAWANPALAWQREAVESGPAAGATQDIFSLSLPLVLSGRLGLERAAARQGAQAALARRDRARAELQHEAILRFYGVVAATERKTVLAESLGRLRGLSQTTAAREKAGDASGYDRLRIALEAATVEDLVRGATTAERAARAAALAMLGPETESLPPLEGSLAPVPARIEGAETGTGFESRRGDVRALQLEARAAETARQGAARGFIPEITVQAGAQILDARRPGESRGYVAGVELPLPLFQRRQGERARAEARRELAQARAAAVLRKARALLTVARETAQEGRARLEAHRTEVLGRAEELQKIAGAAYRGGASDLLALVDAERTARQARLDAIDLAKAVIEADSELLLLTGGYEQPAIRREKP